MWSARSPAASRCCWPPECWPPWPTPGSWPSPLSTVVTLVPAQRQARALAVILGGTTLALIAGVPAGAALGSLWGWRSAMWAIAAISIGPLIAVVLTMPRRSSSAATVSAPLTGELTVLRHGSLRSALLLAVLVNAATFGTFTYLAAIATGPAAVPEPAVAALLALFGLGAFAGVTLAGRWAHSHWRRLLALCLPLTAGGWLLLAAGAGQAWVLWTLALLLGGLSFALGSTMIARIMASAHGAPTLSGAFSTVALNLGAVLGPIVAGVAFERLGAAGPPLVSAGLVLGALALSRR
nr:MFS transporter [Nakamurella aerolata]